MFMYVYSCNALSARFFDVDRALNSYFMTMIMITFYASNARSKTRLAREIERSNLTPAIHVTNSSPVIGHFLRTLCTLRSLRKTLGCLRASRALRCVRNKAINRV